MANEAVRISLGNLQGNVIRRTINAAASISQGALLGLYDVNEVSGANLDAVIFPPFGGIAVSEKLGSDPATTIGVYTDGVFDVKAVGAGIGSTGVAGQAVIMSGANLVKASLYASDFISGCVLGYAEEDWSANEVFRVRLRGN